MAFKLEKLVALDGVGKAEEPGRLLKVSDMGERTCGSKEMLRAESGAK